MAEPNLLRYEGGVRTPEVRSTSGVPVVMPDDIQSPTTDALLAATNTLNAVAVDHEDAIDRKVTAPAGYLRPSKATTIEELRRDVNLLTTMLRSSRGMHRPTYHFEPQDTLIRSRWDAFNDEAMPAGPVASYTSTSGDVTEGSVPFGLQPTTRLSSDNNAATWVYGSVSLDLSAAEFVEIFMHFDNPEALKVSGGTVELRLYTGGGTGDSFSVNTAVRWRASWVGGWQALRVPVDDFLANGAPDWSAITRIRVMIRSVSGTAGVVHLGPVRYGKLGYGVVQLYFDDAYRNVHELALPIFREFGLRATLPVILDATNAADGTGSFMSWRQVRDCADAGWAIVSHSTNNDRLPDLTETEIRARLAACREALIERGYHAGADCLVLPGGSLDAASGIVAQEYTPVMRWGSHGLGNKPLQEFPSAHPQGDAYMSLVSMGSSHPDAIDGATTPETVFGWIDLAIAQRKQASLAFHQVVDTPPEASTQYPVAWLREICEYIRAKIDEGELINLVMTDVNHY